VPIPGIVFLNGQGKVEGTLVPESAKELVEKMDELTK
jgi:hypothetical protein